MEGDGKRARGHIGGTAQIADSSEGRAQAASLRFPFTEAALEALTPAAKKFYVWDTVEPRLCVAVSPGGRRTYFVRYKLAGRSVRYKLGAVGDVQLRVARRRAAAIRGDASQGKDPSAERRAVRQELTVGELVERYAVEHLERNRSARAAPEARQLVKYFIAPLATLRLGDLTRGKVAAWHLRAGDRSKIRANRALALLSAACRFAIRLELAPARWYGLAPTAGVRKFPEKSRRRFLNPAELGRFLAVLDAEHPAMRDFFKVLLMTGARRGNVEAMRWADLDLEAGVWTIPAEQAKAGEDIVIPLVPEALAILRRRQAEQAALEARVARPEPVNGMTFRQLRHRNHELKMACNGREYVFAGRGRTGHLVEPKTAWARILLAAKLEDLRVHDLRRTLGSWLAGRGISAPIIGKALGHRSLQATAVYARLDLAPVRAAMEGAATAFAAAADQARGDAAKVRPIRGRR